MESTPYSFNTASGMDCMQFAVQASERLRVFVSIPQAVWIACNEVFEKIVKGADLFQYRKRYGLHAIVPSSEFDEEVGIVSIPQAVWIACNSPLESAPAWDCPCFNTASGMDCMQCQVR